MPFHSISERHANTPHPNVAMLGPFALYIEVVDFEATSKNKLTEMGGTHAIQ